MKFHLEGLAKDFATNLEERIRKKVERKFVLYAIYGLQHGFRSGFIKKFSENLYEIVIGDLRFLGTIIQQDFYLLVGFQKKSQKTPERMITLAKEKIKLWNSKN